MVSCVTSGLNTPRSHAEEAATSDSPNTIAIFGPLSDRLILAAILSDLRIDLLSTTSSPGFWRVIWFGTRSPHPDRSSELNSAWILAADAHFFLKSIKV
jgi:hypothetical protein